MQAQIISEGILNILGKGKGILPSSKRMKKVQTRPMLVFGMEKGVYHQMRGAGKSPPTGLLRMRVK